MDWNTLLFYKLNKYQNKLEQDPNSVIYQQKYAYYNDLIGGGKKKNKNKPENKIITGIFDYTAVGIGSINIGVTYINDTKIINKITLNPGGDVLECKNKNNCSTDLKKDDEIFISGKNTLGKIDKIKNGQIINNNPKFKRIKIIYNKTEFIYLEDYIKNNFKNETIVSTNHSNNSGDSLRRVNKNFYY